jgi:asparagine synthase (glutamine-hydrolysing)
MAELEYRDRLDQTLSNIYEELAKELSGQKVGVLFSAGVDSSLISVFARDFGLNPTLYNFGTEFSKDKEFAFKLAEDLRLPLEFLEISREEIEENIPFIKEKLVEIEIDPNPMQVALAVGVYLVGKKAKEDGVQLMLCGQGSDELFAGYHKFEGLTEEELQAGMEKGIRSVIASDIMRDNYMLKQSGIELMAPYTNQEFIDLALSIPIDLKIRDGIKKYIIRKVAEKRGLPEYIALRPKNAMQYSSGIQKVVDKINKDYKRNFTKNEQ